MDISKNVSLKAYSTMRLGGLAANLVEVKNRNEVKEAIDWADKQNLPFVMVGGGSNIFWADEGFGGLVLVNRIMGFQKFDEDPENTYLTIGAGENWDSVVARSVKDSLTGIEALSFVPGTAGATPVQNVGAYGQQVSDTLVSVEAYDHKTKEFVTLANADCNFSYRSSRFKTSDKGRFYITGLTLHLRRGKPEPPFYPSVQTYFNDHAITSYTPEVLRQAVINIRQAKLPDPDVVANNGSFFVNPIIDDYELTELIDRHPNLNYWRLGYGKSKVSAAWLIEEAGFKGIHDQETGMATWPKQALVFVNEHAKSTADLLKFKEKVIREVQTKFGITLIQEPELISLKAN